MAKSVLALADKYGFDANDANQFLDTIRLDIIRNAIIEEENAKKTEDMWIRTRINWKKDYDRKSEILRKRKLDQDAPVSAFGKGPPVVVADAQHTNPSPFGKVASPPVGFGSVNK